MLKNMRLSFYNLQKSKINKNLYIIATKQFFIKQKK